MLAGDPLPSETPPSLLAGLTPKDPAPEVTPEPEYEHEYVGPPLARADSSGGTAAASSGGSRQQITASRRTIYVPAGACQPRTTLRYRGISPIPRSIRYIARIRCKGLPGIRITLRARFLDARRREIARGSKCVANDYCQSNTLHTNDFEKHTQEFYLEFRSRQVSPEGPWGSAGRPEKGCSGYGTRVLRCWIQFRVQWPEHRCDRSQPLLADPAPTRTNREQWYEPYQNGSSLPTGYPDSLGRTAELRWGRVTKFKNGLFEDFKGFGFRKIEAKHGWSSIDEQDTRTAMLTPPIRDEPTRTVYVGPSYSQNRVDCRRNVTVAHQRSKTEQRLGNPAQGLVTSYGERRSGR
jgi:hypothetical protein